MPDVYRKMVKSLKNLSEKDQKHVSSYIDFLTVESTAVIVPGATVGHAEIQPDDQAENLENHQACIQTDIQEESLSDSDSIISKKVRKQKNKKPKKSKKIKKSKNDENAGTENAKKPTGSIQDQPKDKKGKKGRKKLK